MCVPKIQFSDRTKIKQLAKGFCLLIIDMLGKFIQDYAIVIMIRKSIRPSSSSVAPCRLRDEGSSTPLNQPVFDKWSWYS